MVKVAEAAKAAKLEVRLLELRPEGSLLDSLEGRQVPPGIAWQCVSLTFVMFNPNAELS